MAKRPLIEVLNLGAGVQSSTVFLMSLKGELPKLDHVIFADTGWEPAAVYRQMDWLEQVATEAGVHVWRVAMNGESIKKWELHSEVRGTKAEGKTYITLPYFTDNGMLKRQCTKNFKIVPIERCIRRNILGLAYRQRAPREVVIRRWYGISHDERQRMRISQDAYAENWYPLVEMRFSRSRCMQWLHDYGYPEAPRSACIGCPYHHNREWLDMRTNHPTEWEEACQFDEAIRKCGGMRGDVFLHSDRIPLRNVYLEKDYDPRQQLLPGLVDECSGMCGV